MNVMIIDNGDKDFMGMMKATLDKIGNVDILDLDIEKAREIDCPIVGIFDSDIVEAYVDFYIINDYGLLSELENRVKTLVTKLAGINFTSERV